MKSLVSPYSLGYGLKWPSSNLVSLITRQISRVPKVEIGLDFACGLGAHGRFLESLGFSKVFYADQDEVALKKSQAYLNSSPFNGTRVFLKDIKDIKEHNQIVDVVVDRAGLQHVNPESLESILETLHLLMRRNKTQSNSFIATEWTFAAPRESQTKRFPNVTYFSEALFLIKKFFFIEEQTFLVSTKSLENLKSANTVVNALLLPK